MNKIEIEILNPDSVNEALKMMVCSARLTQSGNNINDLVDFKTLYNKTFTSKTIDSLTKLPHPTIQKFGVINVVVVGASRRFLAQITRHQNEIKYMSASLQYSDYSDNNAFAIPYNILNNESARTAYIDEAKRNMQIYKSLIDNNITNDDAGYIAPQGLRNVLILSATPYQWKHMISQRTCRRNTDETRIVMLKIWDELFKLSPELFALNTTGPFCLKGSCMEGKMTCGSIIKNVERPLDILKEDYPNLNV